MSRIMLRSAKCCGRLCRGADWATGPSSFVIVALAESGAVDEGTKGKVVTALQKSREALEDASKSKGEGSRPNAGAKILLGILDK